MLENDLRSGERTNILSYAERLGEDRYYEHFQLKEVLTAIKLTADEIDRELMSNPELQNLKSRIHDEINLSFQMAMDKITDVYENLSAKHKE